MSQKHDDHLQRNLSTIDDVDKLREIGKRLQQRTRETEVKNESLRKQIQSQEASIQSLESSSAEDGPLWILAEDDYPEQDSKVVYFDGREFQVMQAKHLSGKTSM